MMKIDLDFAALKVIRSGLADLDVIPVNEITEYLDSLRKGARI